MGRLDSSLGSPSVCPAIIAQGAGMARCMAFDDEAHCRDVTASAGTVNTKPMNQNQNYPAASGIDLQKLVPVLGRSWATIEEIASLSQLPQSDVRVMVERLALPVVRLDGKPAFYIGNPARAVRMRSLQGFVPSAELRQLNLSQQALPQ